MKSSVCLYTKNYKILLREDMILPNVKPIFDEEKDRKYVIENIHNLVVKQTDASGGYGMLIGPKSTKKSSKNSLQK
jgi:uncharacterized circularly permuted ATP-grasp superfamily protein